MPERPAPRPDPWTRPFWDAARERRLVVQCCEGCGTRQHPPGLLCRRCGEDTLDFGEVSGEGLLHTFTVSRRPFVPGFEESLPLAIGLVELVEAPAVRLLANLLVQDTEALHVGMALTVTWQPTTDGFVLPQFRPRPPTTEQAS